MLDQRLFKFGDFEVDAARRLLRKNGELLPLNAKAFDVLLALIEKRGAILSKDELLGKVWHGQIVEEGNLTVQISNLRKIFGERKDENRYVVTVPGRGYSFVADIDPSTNGEMVIERHSVSRIVIDEDQDVRSEPAYTPSRVVPLVLALILIATPIVYFLYHWAATPARDTRSSQLEIKRLTTNGKVSFAALSPDGKMFAYALKELEQNSLWLGFVGGGDDKPLRPSETGRYNDLAFSADGSFVLFAFSGAESRESVLYRMPVLGGAREKIRSQVGSFAVAPDGRRFAFSRFNTESKNYEIVVARLDDGADEAVIEIPDVRSLDSESLSWSPTSDAIAFGATPGNEPYDQVMVADLSDHSFRQTTSHGWKEVIKTSWRDSNSLLLIAQEKNSNTSVSYSQIWRVSLANGHAEQITHDLSSYRSVLNTSGASFLTVELRQMNNVWVAPSSDLSKASQVTFGTFGKYDGLWGLDWTADGKIIFTSTDHQSQVISEMDANGGNVRQLTPPGFNDSVVNASADGRYIVFQSTRAGGSDIWRMNSDGSNVLRLTTDGKSFQPFISPDSRFVYYKSFDGGSGTMRRIPIEGGVSEILTDSEVSYLSVSPDGTRVAAGSGSRLAIYSANGGEPQKHFDLTRFGTLSGNTAWTVDGKAIAYRDRGYGYWLQPVDGGEPQRMKGLPMEKFYNFAWSKDGKLFAFVRGQEIRDVVLFHHPRDNSISDDKD